MQQILNAARSSAADFGGLIMFYVLLWTVGLKAAILGVIAFVAIDAVRRFRNKLGFPRIYLLSSAMAVGFGLVDLVSDNPFMIKYEAVITSAVIGLLFFVGARGKSFLQQIAEQQGGESFDDRPEIIRFFKVLTIAWGVYFVVKALGYVWLGEVLPLDTLLEVRPVVGMVSLGLMMVATWQSSSIIAFLRRAGLARRSRQPLDRAQISAPAGTP